MKIRTIEHHIEKMDFIFGMLVFGAVRVGFEIIWVNMDNNLTGRGGVFVHKQHAAAHNTDQQ